MAFPGPAVGEIEMSPQMHVTHLLVGSEKVR